MSTSCHDCGAVLRFVRMRTGKAMPVNPVPDRRGIVAAIKSGRNYIDGRVISDKDPAAKNETRFRPHWADCPRGKAKKVPAPPRATQDPMF